MASKATVHFWTLDCSEMDSLLVQEVETYLFSSRIRSVVGEASKLCGRSSIFHKKMFLMLGYHAWKRVLLLPMLQSLEASPTTALLSHWEAWPNTDLNRDVYQSIITLQLESFPLTKMQLNLQIVKKNQPFYDLSCRKRLFLSIRPPLTTWKKGYRNKRFLQKIAYCDNLFYSSLSALVILVLTIFAAGMAVPMRTVHNIIR